jgi:hypothetical protein
MRYHSRGETPGAKDCGFQKFPVLVGSSGWLGSRQRPRPPRGRRADLRFWTRDQEPWAVSGCRVKGTIRVSGLVPGSAIGSCRHGALGSVQPITYHKHGATTQAMTCWMSLALAPEGEAAVKSLR